MTSVRIATPEMFEQVHGLLSRFDNPAMSKEDWRRMLFGHGWHHNGEPHGYALFDGDKVVGFIGLIFSTRFIGGKPHRFCNLSSWVVDERYPYDSLKLLLPVARRHDATLTGLTLTSATVKIFGKFGFRELENHVVLLTPLSLAGAWRPWDGYAITTEPDLIAARVSEADRQVLEDHRSARCAHVLLSNGIDYCYVIATRWAIRGVPVSHIHYISHPAIFWQHLARACSGLRRAHGTFFWMLDGRHACGRRPFGSLSRSLPRPRLYRPAVSELSPGCVDALYTELMYLRV